MVVESWNASPPVQTYATGIFLPARTVGVGTFRVCRFRTFLNAHLLQTPTSELRPLTPTSTYKNSFSGPIIVNNMILTSPL